MDGVIGLIDQLLMGSAMVEFVPVTPSRAKGRHGALPIATKKGYP